MNKNGRREFLKTSGSLFGGSWLSLNLPLALAIASTASANQESGAPWQNLTELEAEGFAAIVDQIIPPDETPGASEIGVVFFLDESLNSYLSKHRNLLMKGLAKLESETKSQFGKNQKFSSLTLVDQTGLLKEIENSKMFKLMIEITQLGMFALPEYGGNRNHAGWALIGFEHQHVWQPPFGYYDAKVSEGESDHE